MDGDFKGERLFIGIKQSTEALLNNQVKKAFIAQDTVPPIREPFEDLCREKQIPVTYFDTKQQLGRACGIDVGAACAVVLI